jgi:hypothetical protein
MNPLPLLLIAFCTALGALVNDGHGALVGFIASTGFVIVVTLSSLPSPRRRRRR